MKAETLVEKARRFAHEKHTGQIRKDDKTPYIEHPEKVVELLMYCGVKDENVLAAAYLHDVIEDCGVTEEEIAREFNDNVAEMVYLLTRNVERAEYNARFTDPNTSEAVKLIKLADQVHNCRTLEELEPKKAARKVRECEEIFLPLAEQLSQKLYLDLKTSVGRYKQMLEHKEKLNSR